MLSKYLPRYVGCAGLAELGLCCPPLLFSAAAPVSAERALLLPLIQLQVRTVITVSTIVTTGAATTATATTTYFLVISFV